MFLVQFPASLLDASAGLIARGLWWADWKLLEICGMGDGLATLQQADHSPKEFFHMI
jgi:hypothetical protein